MYGSLALRPKALNRYRDIAGEEVIDEIRRLAAPLRGLRVLHLSVTAFGTGVAELLHATVPLFSDLGLHCDWQVVRPAEEFAAANKALYRALAGAGAEWTPEMSEVWQRYSAMNAELLTEPYDVIVVHDPQPAALRSFVSQATRDNSRWVFHSHLDLSSAADDVWSLFRGHTEGYDAIVFEADAFVHPDQRAVPVTIVPLAIDPLGPRNMELSAEAMQVILHRYSIDPERPLLCQISSCDPSSDLMGVIDVYDQVAQEIPGLQLALIAAYPPQDPASIAYFDETVRKSMEYSDVHILRGPSEVGNVEVNAFQRAADVVIQKGLRKGFGIWISDAQWKGRPVVAASTKGLSQQVLDEQTGFLADSTKDFADHSLRILLDRELAHRLGEAGHQHVVEHFLITRYLSDELRLLGHLTQEGH